MSTSELDGATEPGAENAQSSTPGEFAARWNALDEEQRTYLLRALHAESERAALCKLRHGREPDRPHILLTVDFDSTAAPGFAASIGGVPPGMSAPDFAEGCAQALRQMADEWRAERG